MGHAGRRFGFAIFAVVAIAGGVLLGVQQGQRDDPGFATAPSTSVAQAPFTARGEETTGQSAKQVFGHTCGTCHTLRAAGVTGGIGPDLDKSDRKLTAATVRAQIRTGSLDSSMPANLLVGDDAERVARYVARVAAGRR